MVFKDFIKFGVTIDIVDGKKKTSAMPKNWNKLTESIYKGEDHFAVLTGKINDVLVIDLDRKDDEFIGLEWFERNFSKLSELNTLVTETINGGYHIYFKFTDQIKNVNNFGNLHIDILGNDKCCYQGKKYPVIYNGTDNVTLPANSVCVKGIRAFTDNEIEKITNIINKIPENKQIIKQYSKANALLGKPRDTQWIVVKTDKGIKATPECFDCLVDPRKIHSQCGHSALFINNDKSVIKSCFGCGTENLSKAESKKVMNVFNIVMNIVEDSSIYQQLVSEVNNKATKEHYKREENTGNVYKQIKPYAYIYCMSPQDFLNDLFLDDPDFTSNVNNMDNLIKYMKQYNNSDFPFLKCDKNLLGFQNGVLDITTCEFRKIDDNEVVDFVVRKYFDYPFTGSQDTPLLDSILDYQGFDKEVQSFIYMTLGRMFQIRDKFGFMLYLLGEANCGKSLLINIMCECFNNVGAISDTFEEKFGLSFLYDKDLIVCDDLPKNIAKVFPQQTFQTCITGGKVSIAVKGGNGFTVDWNIPMLWAGNFWISYIDKGQISRRVLTLNFEKTVTHPDPTLQDRIIQTELSAFIYKSLLLYKNVVDTSSNKGIWNICPQYFLDQQEELKMERNPLYKFIYDNCYYKDGNVLKMEEIREAFSEWLGKPISKLERGTFVQVNKDYVYCDILFCKHCNDLSKSGCCDKYNTKDRKKKTIVKNIAFL
jgi:phage/plasmid-associated DNA primase